MAATVTVYVSTVSSADQIVWNGISGDLDGWMIVVHAMCGGSAANMGPDPGAFDGGWPVGAFQLLTQADTGDGLTHMRVWATKFHDTDTRHIVLPNDSRVGAESHSHLYFLSGTRDGEDAAEVFSVGASTSATAGTAQPLPLYSVDGTELLIGSWLSGALGNFTTLGGLTMRAELDGAFSTTRTGEQTLSSAGPSSRTATVSVGAPWAAVSIAVRQPAVGSVTFPQTPLRMKTELALGANPNQDPAFWAGLWTDISDDAQPRDGGVAIKLGRADETSTVGPSSMTGLTLDNSAGRYVRLNPNGPYYGLLSKNTPIQNWIDVGDGWRLRYRGFVSEFPPKSRGGQVDEHMPIEAAGITRRLARGRVLNSPLRKAITSRGEADAYWPLESDGSSGLLDRPAMVTRGATSFGDGGPPGSAGALTAPYGSSTFSIVQGMASTGGWQVSWWLEQPEGATDVSPVIRWLTPNSFYGRWNGYADTGLVTVEVTEHFALLGHQLIGTVDIRGKGPVQVTVRAINSGSDMIYYIFVNGVLDATEVVPGDVAAPVTTAGVNNLNFVTPHDIQGTVSHLFISVADPGISNTAFAASLAWLLDAGAGHPGERATDRIRRVSSEANIPVLIVGDGGRSEPMGPQPINDFLDILRDCEAADGGVLFERRDGRLAYQARAGRYNATPTFTLDYAAGDVAPPLEPTDDDQHLRNDFTASRANGGSAARVLDQAHIDEVGEYADSGTVNVAGDIQLPHQAGWRVHLGTADDLRYSAITPNLNGQPSLITDWAAADVGSAAAITNPGRDLPPGQVDVFVEGYTETIDTVSWVAIPNCSPGKPWKVIRLDDTVLGRLASAGSALNSSVTTTGTSLSVKTTSGPLWSIDAGDRPFDVVIGGEVMTVTNVTGGSSPQTFTVTRSINGVIKTHAANEPVALALPPILAQ
jgi:hypothetical protein